MFDTLPISRLSTILAHFAFPMLIAERPDQKTEFRTVATNAPFEKIAGPMDTMNGSALRQMVPQVVVDHVVRAFKEPDLITTSQQFNATIFGEEKDIPCELTLQYLRAPERYDRVVVTARPTPEHDLDLQDKLAFEDVRYFSFLADLQLENLNNAFVCATEQIDEERIMRLHAVCRTIQRTVSDINNVVKQAQARHAAQGGSCVTPPQIAKDQPGIPYEAKMFDVLARKPEALSEEVG